MCFSRTKPLLLAAVLLVTACQPVIQTAPPIPSPEIWRIQTTPALEWLGAVFQQCASAQAGIRLVVSEQPASNLDSSQADFSFQWGNRAAPPPFTAVIGQDDLAVVVHPQNPITTLLVSEVKAVISGQETDWSVVIRTTCPACSSNFGGPIKAYGYSRGEDVAQAADWILPGEDAILAPDPAAVRQAVSAEPYSIGFLPARWLNGTVKRVALGGEVPGGLSRPVLAMAQTEPVGAKRAWLLCVQGKLQ